MTEDFLARIEEIKNAQINHDEDWNHGQMQGYREMLAQVIKDVDEIIESPRDLSAPWMTKMVKTFEAGQRSFAEKLKQKLAEYAEVLK